MKPLGVEDAPPEESTLREAIVKLLAHKSGKRIPKNLLPPRGGYLTASPYLTEDQIEQLVQLIQERERLARIEENRYWMNNGALLQGLEDYKKRIAELEGKQAVKVKGKT